MRKLVVSEYVTLDGVFQEEAHAHDKDQNAQAQQPGAGDGEFHGDPDWAMLLADDDPVPDLQQNLPGRAFKAARLARRPGRCQ